jgi:hypothetical protein
MIHLAFPSVVMAKAVVGVCKGSWSKTTPELLVLCGKGEQMVMVTRVIYLAMHVMQYESKHILSVTTLDDASVDTREKCYIIWEVQFLLPQEL